MKTTLIAINAKYPHTNPAVRSIAAFARLRGIAHISFQEYTINQRSDAILSRLFNLDCDVYLFSCYIWNIELVRVLAGELRKIRPSARIWAGGPEVSWNSAEFLEKNPAFDLVVRGEGEETVAALLSCLQDGSSFDTLPGICLRQEQGAIIDNGISPAVELDALPFPYGDLDQLNHRVLYYESMRGCPFRCSYCISSIEQGVRYRDLDLVFQDLMRFIRKKVPRVKFVDRTFNCDKKRALALWRFLQQNDNGVTNFHFELAAELLDSDCLDFLATVRPGLFQFEIGVQSANTQTLDEISRTADLERLYAVVRRLSTPGNIHLHLDLIAGLPYEDYSSFAQSFNTVYMLEPAQLQVGFLKVLKGSAMARNAPGYQLVHRDAAPYEVLSTRWLSYGELERLKGVEEMVELYYNSGRFHHMIRNICARFPTPFACYEALSGYWRAQGLDDAPPDKTACYQVLAGFLAHLGFPITQHEQCLCRYDIALHEKPKKLPPFAQAEPPPGFKKAVSDFYHHAGELSTYLPGPPLSPREAANRSHIELFPFHPGTGTEGPVVLLFDYGSRDVFGHAAVVELPRNLFHC